MYKKKKIWCNYTWTKKNDEDKEKMGKVEMIYWIIIVLWRTLFFGWTSIKKRKGFLFSFFEILELDHYMRKNIIKNTKNDLDVLKWIIQDCKLWKSKYIC